MGHAHLFCSVHYWESLSSWSKPSSSLPSWPPLLLVPLQLMLRLILSMAMPLPTLLPLCMPYQSARSSPRPRGLVRAATLSLTAPQNLWWSVRPSRDMRTQSVLRSRFPLLLDTHTLARERLMLKLSPSSASATPLPSLLPTLSRPSPVFLELPSLRMSVEPFWRLSAKRLLLPRNKET